MPRPNRGSVSITRPGRHQFLEESPRECRQREAELGAGRQQRVERGPSKRCAKRAGRRAEQFDVLVAQCLLLAGAATAIDGTPAQT